MTGDVTGGDSADRPERSALARFEVDERAMGNAGTNTVPFNPRLTTHDGQQFLAYWDHDGSLQVACRDLPDGSWRTSRLPIEIDQRDGHYAPALGVGPEGHVFLCYNTRNSPIRWRRSDAPGDVTAFGEETVGMTGLDEDSACYPEFTRLRDGSLLFGYREGSSGNGDWHLNRWNPDTGTWNALVHPLTDGQGERNSYHWNLLQSGDGTLHYFFCWRNNDLPGVGNENLCYARSPDQGATWARSDGTDYSLPIRKSNAEVVDPVETGNDFINQGWASFDPRSNEPHVAYYRNDDEGHTQIYHAFHAGDDWTVEAVTDRDSDLYLTEEFRSTDPKALGRPGIVVDDDGAVYVLTRDARRGGWPLLFSKIDGRWTVDVLYRRNLIYGHAHLDPERWRADRVLSFVDQPQTTLAFDPARGAPWAGATTLAVTDVDPGRFADPGTGPRNAGGGMVTFASTGLDATAIDATSFVDVAASLSFSEATFPATPVFARCTASARPPERSSGTIRLSIEDVADQMRADLGRQTAGTAIEEPTVHTTGWVRIPDGIRAGTVGVQANVDEADEPLSLRTVTLELAYRDPRPSLETVVSG